MVVQEPTDDFDYRGKAKLFRAAKGRAEWEERPTPGALIGAAFESDLKGFAWSIDSAFVTADGGLTWSAVSVSPWLLAAPGWPSLIPRQFGGGMLVPLKTLPLGDGSSRLIRVGWDLKINVVAQWDHVMLDGLALSDDSILIGARPWLSGPSKLYASKLGSEMSGFREVWSSETERIHQLATNGGRIYFLAVGEWGKSGFLGSTPTALLEGTSRNWAWVRTDITRQRVDSICIAPGGVWTLGGWKRHLAYSQTD
jgi:hypothetical protein